MVIEGKFYRLTQISDSSPFWDLELLYTVRPKGKEARVEFKNAGYGMTLISALIACCSFATARKLDKEVVTLKEYVDAYNKSKEEILSELKGFNEPVSSEAESVISLLE